MATIKITTIGGIVLNEADVHSMNSPKSSLIGSNINSNVFCTHSTNKVIQSATGISGTKSSIL